MPVHTAALTVSAHVALTTPGVTLEVVMNRLSAITAIVALVAVAGPACATKKYVRTSVDEVSGKVSTLTDAVEETQEQTNNNSAQIKKVDSAAQAAQQTAQQADKAADQALNVAKSADNLAKSANAKAEVIDQASRKVVYEVVLRADDVSFGFGQSDLSDAAKMSLAGMVDQLKRDPRNVFIVIEGYTDSVGPSGVNDRLGLARAEAVERYLYEQYQIPLPKMDVISYGEENAVAPNNTREGRAQNRRVVVKVMA
jgi:outer membrane protein OmpA-like peptidoglycan-associated protein